jgi:putative endonuclease
MTFAVYVLRSTKNCKRYVGFTSRLVEDRLHDHLTGSNRWTRQNGPFVIIHTEMFNDKSVAMKREKFLKSGQGRMWLDNNIPG